MWWTILLAITASAILLLQLSRANRYWKKKGVKQINPIIFFGDGLSTIFLETIPEFLLRMYNAEPDARYFGVYTFNLPTLILRDPNLIKEITVTAFDHFVDHRSLMPEQCEPLWSNNLFSLKGQKWREVRAALSPAFTGTKMKLMFNLITKNGERFVKHFLERNEDLIEVEMKDIMTRFTNDVIANTAFGVEVDSLAQQTNEFYFMGKEVSTFSKFTTNLKILVTAFAPKITTFFNIGLYSRQVNNFFTSLVNRNIEIREQSGVNRPDMIQLLMEAKKKKEITDQEIVSQAMIFFFAGFDSVSNLMCFTAHELAENPDIQARLIEEIDENWEECQGGITYDALIKMKYLDMVVNESLRKWPINLVVDRECTKPYVIQPKKPGEVPVQINVGDNLWLPIIGIHRDPKHFPNPEKFDPERFSEANRGMIQPYTFIPFGSGPRICIGARFTYLETKVLFFYILRYFEIVPTGRTQIPLVISKNCFNLTANGGFVLGLRRRPSS